MSSPDADIRDLSAALLDSTIILTVVGALFVSTRLWVRFFTTKAHSWDDYFIMGSLAASLASMSLTIAMVQHGYGKTKDLLDPAQMTIALKYSNFAVLVNGFAMGFLKISIGLSLLRLQLGKGMAWVVWGSMFLSVAVNAIVLVSTLFGCRPLAAVWDRSLMPIATCLPRTVNVVNSYIQTTGNILTDLIYSFGPLYYLSKVKVSVYNKWALRGVFTLGLLATICAIAKCTELPKLGSSTNPTYDGTRITIWVRAELNAGLVAAAMPPLKSLFEDVLRKVFGVRSQLRTTTPYATQSSGIRRTRPHDPEDDEIAIREYAAYMHSSNKFRMHQYDRESADSASFDLVDQHGVESRERNKNSGNSDEYGTRHQAPITKTVSYTVRHDSSE